MTEVDKTRQELNDKQVPALYLILAGKSDQEIADEVGVSRQTVNLWCNHDPLFNIELNRLRQALRESFYGKLSGLTNDAIQVLGKSLKNKDPKIQIAAAVHVLKSQGLYGQIWNPETLNEASKEYIREYSRYYFKEKKEKRSNLARENYT